MSKSQSSSTPPPFTPIAIVGMDCIFPEAENLAQYWDNIVREVDCITDVPPSRWRSEDYFDADPQTPDKTYCKRGGFIPEIDFDPIEFGLPPNILEATDVSQLLSLVVAKRALEDAGYGEGRDFDRDRVGVILGVGGGQKLIFPLGSRLNAPIWRRALKSSGIDDADADKIIDKIKAAYVPWEENSFPGLLGNVIAGRIASRLNLGGTNCVVDAACAATLGAATMAIADLVEGRSDMIITGGVDTDNSIFMYMCFSKTPALTPSDHARPFDADSDGTLIGEGIGMMVLKRLADARRDGDRVYAVIRGIGSSSDGRSKSIYAPRADGQAKALARAYQAAGIAPQSVALVEAHGTGTRAGDVCEVAALQQVFGGTETQGIALGSVKSQIGHTKAAAGAAGLIKTALALHHKVLPPTLHVTTPNPKLDLQSSAFYLNTRTRPWLQTSARDPRRAGVSALGFGGTNFHFVLEEYDGEAAASLQCAPRTILLHAETRADLAQQCARVLSDLQADAQTFETLAAASHSMVIPPEAHRLGFVARSVADVCTSLDAAIPRLKGDADGDWEYQGLYYRERALIAGKKVVALFPGQGSQYIEMGRELALNFAAVRQTWQAMDDLGADIGRTVFPVPVFDDAQRAQQSEVLRRTECAQPAIGAFSAGLYKLLQAAGFQPDFVGGHSFGELTALWAAGVLSDADFFALAKARGEAMASSGDPQFDAGAMLAAKGDVDLIEDEVERLPEISIANFNSQDQIVLAGPKECLEQARSTLESRGIKCVALPVSAAFHTPLVAHAEQPFAAALKTVTFRKPQLPVYSNATSERYTPHSASMRKTLRQQILKPVLFKQEIERIYADGGFCFVEVGPKSVLTGLVKNILGERPHLAVALNPTANGDSDLQLRQALVKLRVAGLALTELGPAPEYKSVPQRRNQMNVRLSGNNYVSPKTQAHGDEILRDGHQIGTPAPASSEGHSPTPIHNKRQQIPDPGESMSTKQTPDNKRQQTPDPGESMSTKHTAAPPNAEFQGQMLANLERSLEQFYTLQSETLRVHEQYLRGQMEYSRTFFQLMQQQYALLGQGVTPQPAPNGMQIQMPQSVQPVAPPPVPVAPIAPVVSQPAPSAVQPASNMSPPPVTVHSNPPPVQPAPQPPPPSYTAEQVPVPPAPLSGHANGNGATAPQEPVAPTGGGAIEEVDVEMLTRSMLKIVSETTGYPEDVLDMDMDIEADLGIDSIKRVEILGAMQEAHPDLPPVSPEDLAELRSFAQIVAYIQDKANV